MGSSDVDFFIHSYYEFKLFGVTLSINTTMVTTVIVCLILLALILFARHEIMKDYDEPNVVQNVVEMIDNGNKINRKMDLQKVVFIF